MSEGCEGKDPRLAAWVDGEVAKDERRRVASHVILCDDCATEVGHMVAEKALLERGEEAAAAPAPKELWGAITSGLDHVDGTHTALARRRATHRYRLPALVGVGATLVALALALSAYMGRPGNMTAQLLALHKQALSSAGMALFPASGLQAVGASYHEPDLYVRWRAIEKLNGAFAIHRLCMAGRLPVSVITLPANAVSTTGMDRVAWHGKQMYIDSTPRGSVAVVVREGMATVVIANTTSEDLMQLAAQATSFSGISYP